jgi:hypothetical protein
MTQLDTHAEVVYIRVVERILNVHGRLFHSRHTVVGVYYCEFECTGVELGTQLQFVALRELHTVEEHMRQYLLYASCVAVYGEAVGQLVLQLHLLRLRELERL